MFQNILYDIIVTDIMRRMSLYRVITLQCIVVNQALVWVYRDVDFPGHQSSDVAVAVG